MAQESPSNKKDQKNAKLWEEKVKTPGTKMYLKKGGSHLNKDMPFMRTENSFNKKYHMNKLLKVIYDPEHTV